jgi:site-specific DNA-methyltransferase (adenine-specific)
MIKAGSRVGDIILDPFAGSGTTLLVARKLGRSAIGLDLSITYLKDNATKRLELDKLKAWTR